MSQLEQQTTQLYQLYRQHTSVCDEELQAETVGLLILGLVKKDLTVYMEFVRKAIEESKTKDAFFEELKQGAKL